MVGGQALDEQELYYRDVEGSSLRLLPSYLYLSSHMYFWPCTRASMGLALGRLTLNHSQSTTGWTLLIRTRVIRSST